MARDFSDPIDPIAACREDLAKVAELWRSVAARSAPRARREAEVQVFNQMVVALDSRFAGSAGPLSRQAPIAREMRLLAQGVAQNDGWFPQDDAARWRPDASVTGYRPGDKIALDAEVFARLADVYLAEIARQMAAPVA